MSEHRPELNSSWPFWPEGSDNLISRLGAMMFQRHRVCYPALDHCLLATLVNNHPHIQLNLMLIFIKICFKITHCVLLVLVTTCICIFCLKQINHSKWTQSTTNCYAHLKRSLPRILHLSYKLFVLKRIIDISI